MTRISDNTPSKLLVPFTTNPRHTSVLLKANNRQNPFQYLLVDDFQGFAVPVIPTHKLHTQTRSWYTTQIGQKEETYQIAKDYVASGYAAVSMNPWTSSTLEAKKTNFSVGFI